MARPAETHLVEDGAAEVARRVLELADDGEVVVVGISMTSQGKPSKPTGGG